MNQLDILRLSAGHAGDPNDADNDTVMKLAYLTGVAEAMADKEAADLVHVPESDPGRLTSETRSALLDALKERSGKKHRTLGMVGVGLGGLAAGAGGMHLYRKMKERKREQKKEASIKLALGEEMAKRLMKAEHRYRGLGVAKTNPGASEVVKALGIGGVADPRAHRERLHEIIVRSYGKERGSSDQSRRQLYGALNSAAAAKHLMMSLNKEQIHKKLTGKDPSLMDRFLGSLGPREYA